MDLPATLLDGVLLGGLYALFAAGLSLIFGVMRLVNIAHGDLILLSAFLALTVTTHFPIHPLLSLLLVVPCCRSSERTASGCTRARWRLGTSICRSE